MRTTISVDHLSRDRKLRKVITATGPLSQRKNADLYLSLLRAIVGQQLSVKAAQTIWNRFLELFNGEYPAPELVISIDVERLRGAGLSYQKAGYLANIARFSFEKTLDYKKLKTMSDDELVEYLVQIKGVGRWTVEMILMFNLGRQDVFPKDDLGIQNGMIELYKLQNSNKKQFLAEMEKVAEKWRPYRSLACMYIWRSKDDRAKK